MYVKRKHEGRSHNNCCRGKAKIITYTESVFVALVSSMQCARAILLSLTCPTLQHLSTSSDKRHNYRKTVIKHKMCVLIFSTNSFWNISHSKKWAWYKKCILFFTHSTRYSCPSLTILKFSRQIFDKYSNIKFHKNLLSGSRVPPCGQTDGRMDGQTSEANSRFSLFYKRA
jgi:hypothetical protein